MSNVEERALRKEEERQREEREYRAGKGSFCKWGLCLVPYIYNISLNVYPYKSDQPSIFSCNGLQSHQVLNHDHCTDLTRTVS